MELAEKMIFFTSSPVGNLTKEERFLESKKIVLTRNWGSTIFWGQLIQTNLLFKLFYTFTYALKTFDSIDFLNKHTNSFNVYICFKRFETVLNQYNFNKLVSIWYDIDLVVFIRIDRAAC